MKNAPHKLGLWLVGAAGNVAVTVAVGLAALRRKLTEPIGLATAAEPLSKLPLVKFDNIVLGGHEISRRRVVDVAEAMRETSGVFSEALLKAVRTELTQYEKRIRTGRVVESGDAIAKLATRAGSKRKTSARTTIDALRTDLREFAKQNKLARVVVVHVASTEPPFKTDRRHSNWATLEPLLTRGTSPLPASSLYAIAAIEEGMPFVCFTPSLGCEAPAIRELAEMRGVPIMGSDGKTGETMLKTVLAPMFRDRQFRIQSWVGHNILGNGDGAILDAAANKSSKLQKKDSVVGSIVGYKPETRTSIEYVRSLDDWKTAWDHVHFTGFLNQKMILQFVWQGCDSILAAPLIIDLARLADYHAASGRSGVMKHLACFFKSPMDVAEHDFSRQVAMLHAYAEQAIGTGDGRGRRRDQEQR